MASTPFSENPFVVLGLPVTASREDVRRAFRQRARETHPDHRPEDPQAARRFTRLHAAYRAALERVDEAPQPQTKAHVHARPHPNWRERAAGVPNDADTARNAKGVTEYELSVRVGQMRDSAALFRVFERHGGRPMIAAVLGRNRHFPTSALEGLREATENHWTVEAAIAARDDLSHGMLLDIARLAREPVIGMAIVSNKRTTSDVLDALVAGPIRMEMPLEMAVAAHPSLSAATATRLASRYATSIPAVLRLIERSDLSEDLLQRLAVQTSRPTVVNAARDDLMRRGLTVPPLRPSNRSTKTMTGYWC